MQSVKRLVGLMLVSSALAGIQNLQPVHASAAKPNLILTDPGR